HLDLSRHGNDSERKAALETKRFVQPDFDLGWSCDQKIEPVTQHDLAVPVNEHDMLRGIEAGLHEVKAVMLSIGADFRALDFRGRDVPSCFRGQPQATGIVGLCE